MARKPFQVNATVTQRSWSSMLASMSAADWTVGISSLSHLRASPGSPNVTNS